MNTDLKHFISLVMDENLSQAQNLIQEKLNEKLGTALNAKFEEFAPAIFEAKDAKPDFLDLDKDGDTKESMKQAARQAEGEDEDEDEDEAEDEEQSEEEEEGGSEEEETEEDDQDSEEDSEDSEEEKD
jgi:hypothetical protein